MITKRLFLLIMVLVLGNTYAQQTAKGPYDINAIVNESIQVFDTDGKQTEIKIPQKGQYLLFYRYRWMNLGKGVDNADSIRLLEEKIATILLGGMIGNLKVICLAYDKATDYPTWKTNIAKEKPFKTSAKYEVEYYNINGLPETEKKCKEMFTKLSMFAPDGRVIRHASSIAKFNYHMRDEKLNLKGKVVTDDNGIKEPLNNIVVHVESGNRKDTLGKATTDQYGDFEMKIPNGDTAYTILADPKSEKVKNVLLLTQEGKEISYLKKGNGNFKYKLLKADLLELTEMKIDEDLTLTFKKFEGGKEKELSVIEDITYDVDKYDIDRTSQLILDKVVSMMKENEKIKLEVISHTDSRGDDANNLSLSQKRATAVADYLVSKGISKKRITAIGKGESQIRNRCSNGINCTDKEHRYNRRTEFKFSK